MPFKSDMNLSLTIPVLAKQSIMLRKRTSVKNLKVKAIKDYNYGSRYGHPDWYRGRIGVYPWFYTHI